MPKLPADLPENWTRGQIVSPNGTETGLTEKHGYNYLMKQVNNTQTEVNNINTALTDVAQQETVDEIKNKIGTEIDADTQPTLFGRLAQLKKVLLEKLAEVITKITGIDNKIGTSGDAAGTETLFGQVKDISEKMPTGAVKSVQRGIFLINNSGSMGGIYDIPIATVNPEKCIINLMAAKFGYNSGAIGSGVYVRELSENNLKIFAVNESSGSYDVNYCSWEISEFF